MLEHHKHPCCVWEFMYVKCVCISNLNASLICSVAYISICFSTSFKLTIFLLETIIQALLFRKPSKSLRLSTSLNWSSLEASVLPVKTQKPLVCCRKGNSLQQRLQGFPLLVTLLFLQMTEAMKGQSLDIDWIYWFKPWNVKSVPALLLVGMPGSDDQELGQSQFQTQT